MTARTNKPTKVPSLPTIPADASPQLKQYLAALSEAIDIRLGRRGDARDRAITMRELIDSGLALELANRPYDPNNTSGYISPSVTVPNLAVPPTPTGVAATGAYSLVFVEWDLPYYVGHAGTEIWRHDQDILGDAQLIGVSGGANFVDPVGEGFTGYYWVRHVNKNDVYGPYHAANGAYAETALDVESLLETLNGAITENELWDGLSSKIDTIGALETYTGYLESYTGDSLVNRLSSAEGTITSQSVSITALTNSLTALDGNIAGNASAVSALDTRVTTAEGTITSQGTAITGLVNDLTTAEGNIAGNATNIGTLTTSVTTLDGTVTSLSSTVNTLSTTVGNNTAAISTNASSINGVEAKYTVKIDNNGYVTGYGLISTANNGTPTSAWYARVDQFVVGAAGSNATPFTVQTTETVINGVTVPAGVYMTDAFIKNGTITNTKIANAAIDDAKISTLSASKITTGTLDATNVTIAGVAPTFDIKSASSGQRMEMKSDVIKIFDSNEVQRVTLGNLLG
jgi:uncharacterized coiled-coil protein SlyX